MKSTHAAGEAAEKKRRSASREHTARVSIATAEKIQQLADQYDQPPALIAGSLAEIGCNLIAMSSAAEAAGVKWESVMMQVVRRTLPEPKCVVPVLTTEWTHETSLEWVKNLARPIDEWAGQLIEIGVCHHHKEGLLAFLTEWQTSFFIGKCFEIRGDNGTCAKAAALLKPAPKAPPALVSFARHLAREEGGAA